MTVDGTCDHADQRPLRRTVLFLPDRNVGGRQPHLHIRTTDSKGVGFQKSGTFTVATALTVDAVGGAAGLGRPAQPMLNSPPSPPKRSGGWNRSWAARLKRRWPAWKSRSRICRRGVGGNVGQDDLDRRRCGRLRLVRRSNARRRRRVLATSASNTLAAPRQPPPTNAPTC